MAKRTRKKKATGQPSGGEALPPGVKLVRTLEGHQGAVMSVAFDRHGGMLASGNDDNTVKLWEVRSGKLVRTLDGHQDVVMSVAFDPQGRMLASGSADGTVKLWDSQSGEPLRTLDGHQRGGVDRVAFDPHDGTLASGVGRAVQLWDARSGRLLRTLDGMEAKSIVQRFVRRAGCWQVEGSTERRRTRGYEVASFTARSKGNEE
jgi:WD40 repeat protein